MLLIQNGKIWTMAGKNYDSGCILIENGKIKEIAERIEPPDVPDLAVIDAAGAVVMPGMIEAHCHIGIIEEKKGAEGDDCNEATNPVTPWLRAIDAVNPMDAAFDDTAAAGITAVQVGPGSANVVGGQFMVMKTKGSRRIDDLVVKSPSAMKIAFGENPKVCYGDMSQIPSTRMAIAGLLREELFKARQYQQEKEKGDLEKEDFRMECWLPVLRKEIPLKAHVHRVDDILTAIRIAKEFNLALTLDHCTEGHLIAGEIKESGFPAIVGPELTTRSKIEVQYMDFKTVGCLQEHGVLAAITTDHPVSLIQYLPLCAGLAVKKGLPMEEGLKAITINAARICGVDDRMGSLEPGKDADIAIFDGNPLEIFTSCLYTLINGRIVYQKDNPEDLPADQKPVT
ncbi:amidohydrolase [Diplocloster hominis]|uniref:amidohydrolase n=1 Tax=Diplocloster hominis TaxID=3079010 RepID=UPI0031BB9687